MQGTQNSQNSLEKDNIGELTIPSFKTYYKATIIETMYNWNKDKYIAQCNRIEGPEINPFTIGN